MQIDKGANLAVVIVIADQFSAKIRQEGPKIGLTGETKPE